MKINFKYILLSSQFHKDYPPSLFPEILHKPNRPHIMFLIKVESIYFAIPFRSKINHRHAFLTSPKERKGIDYSKAIVISDPKYIIKTFIMNRKEHNAISRNKRMIFNEFRKYIQNYKGMLFRNRDMSGYEFSTLQYFKEEIIAALNPQIK